MNAILPDPSRNEDLLRRLYDPAYVRRVGLGRPLAPVQVCLDSRMLDVRGTGVATYSSVLARCLPRTGAAAMVLRQAGPGSASSRNPVGRWMAAWDGRTRLASGPSDQLACDSGLHELICADVFREAHVFFDIHRKLMPVSSPQPPRVMHWTYPVPLFLRGSRNVYTVHDVIPLLHPRLTPIRKQRHAMLLKRIVERAHRLVAVSEAARGEIAGSLALAPDRIASLSQAVDIPIQCDPGLPAGLTTGGYFLTCGTIEPRKNLIAVAQAHAASGSSLPLVVVGPDGWRSAQIKRTLSRMSGVILLPWQERDILIGLMRRARGLILASLAEGFGLPIAEAMTLGTPVITSALPATAETAGGAALLVDPRSVSDIATAFAALTSDTALVARLRQSGFARAQHFTTDRYALRLRDFYAGLAHETDAENSAKAGNR